MPTKRHKKPRHCRHALGARERKAAQLAQAAVFATLIATGFGVPQANGRLTQLGLYAGKPYYRIGTDGWYVYWHAPLNSWEIGATDPNEDGDRKFNSYGDIPYPTNPWVNDGCPATPGTIRAM